MSTPFGTNPLQHSERKKTILLDALPAPHKLYARALPGLFKRWKRSAPHGAQGAALPALRLVRSAVPLDAGMLERYARVCGFIPEHGIPLTFPHLLAFPLHLLLLTDPAFPWSALGLVHLANRVHLRQPLARGDVLRIEAEFGAQLRHPKGQAFVLHARAYRRGEAVWDGDSLYLKRGVRGYGEAAGPLDIDSAALARTARWQLPAQLGRDYAKASGDYNPIHLSALSAQVFGFPRAIAHGMWTLGRAAAALQPARPLAAASFAAEFKTPMLLPGEATLWTAAHEANGCELEVRDAGGVTPHLRGRFQWSV
ncbi:MAG TPA: MaoC/PaaZ C-terminal domain-containing protein [Paraburkholderia sp.]|nr:MaoC/PaaZ C-terminal domain-containing protein [Paraburkholderia sp.]